MGKLKGRKPYVSMELLSPRYKPIPSKAGGRVRLATSSLNPMQVVVMGGGFPSYSTYNTNTAIRMMERRKKLLKKRR